MGVTLQLETRAQNQVENEHETVDATYGEKLEAANLKSLYPAAIHRPTPVCATYNCHGLTFASRRTQILDPAEVRRILVEDGYQRIGDVRAVLPGDVAIYVSQDGDIEHSGVVVALEPGMLVATPVIVSKWGAAHEVIHRFNYSPYSSSLVQYFRVVA